MAEYIEREKALNVCEMHYQHCLEMRDWHGDSIADDIKTDIETIPTADVVEVVRCKDCKHWNNGDCYRIELTRHNDYCSYGERKPKEAVSLVDGHIDKSNKCVSCGTDIPEGTWTCPSCDRRWQ